MLDYICPKCQKVVQIVKAANNKWTIEACPTCGFQFSEETPPIQRQRRYRSSVHMNGNILCVIDTETTGLNPFKNEIIQLAVLPLTPELNPSKDTPFFDILIKPERLDEIDLEADKVTRGLVVEAINHGMDKWTALDRFTEWFYETLKPPYKKKIVPLGHNFANHDRPFLVEWTAGPASYDEFFRSDHRDTMTTALMFNDLADIRNERPPYPKYNLKYLCSCLGIPHEHRHHALSDCLVTAECYKRMLLKGPQ